MPDIAHRVEKTDWRAVSDEMQDKGYAVLPGFLCPDQCRSMIGVFDSPEGYRKTVVMERYRFGLGTYKYWHYPLPGLVQSLREKLYPKLMPIANAWMVQLNIDRRFPETFEDFQATCHKNGQLKPTPLILHYGEGGYNTLHQDLYGEVYFPIQAACFLSEPDEDYTGGEFVFTQQVPRAQSRAIVLKPKRGDMILFATQFRPVKGARGYYRATMKHGVSSVLSGNRYTLGIIFHDAVA